MKCKYVVSIEETVIQEFEVFADNATEALKMAEDKYKSGEFVLEPGDVIFKQMAIVKPDDEMTEWLKF